MPKKATPARSGVQRTKPKTQKSFELVRPVTEVQEREIEETSETVAEPTIVESTSEIASTNEFCFRTCCPPNCATEKS